MVLPTYEEEVALCYLQAKTVESALFLWFNSECGLCQHQDLNVPHYKQESE